MYLHHRDVAGGILSLVTCSGPINGREAFWGVVVGFVAHTVDISYRDANKSLARPTSRCILFDGENISYDAVLVIYINRTNIPPIMIINRIHETQNILYLSAAVCHCTFAEHVSVYYLFGPTNVHIMWK
jgi:hypothetical protein